MQKSTDKLTFGKYKGDTISQVIKSDPGYLWWCVNNVSFFNPSVKLKNKIFNAFMSKNDDRSEYVPEEHESEFQFMDFNGNY